MSRARIEAMLVESGFDAEEMAGLVDALAPLNDLGDRAPDPSVELQALFGPARPSRPAPTRASFGRRRGALAGAAVIAFASVGATGLSAAANTLPRPLQHHVAQFSHDYLPFDLPEPPPPGHPLGASLPQGQPGTGEIAPSLLPPQSLASDDSTRGVGRPGTYPSAGPSAAPAPASASARPSVMPSPPPSPSSSPSAAWQQPDEPSASPSPGSQGHGGGKDGQDKPTSGARPQGKNHGFAADGDEGKGHGHPQGNQGNGQGQGNGNGPEKGQDNGQGDGNGQGQGQDNGPGPAAGNGQGNDGGGGLDQPPPLPPPDLPDPTPPPDVVPEIDLPGDGSPTVGP